MVVVDVTRGEVRIIALVGGLAILGGVPRPDPAEEGHVQRQAAIAGKQF